MKQRDYPHRTDGLHPSIANLARLIDGRLTPAEASEISRHVLVCTICHDAVDAVEAVLARRQERLQTRRSGGVLLLAVCAASWLLLLPSAPEATPDVSPVQATSLLPSVRRVLEYAHHPLTLPVLPMSARD